MTYFQLMLALKSTEPGAIVDANGVAHYGVVQGIQKEDGSGKCWNLTQLRYSDGERITFFVRTVD